MHSVVFGITYVLLSLKSIQGSNPVPLNCHAHGSLIPINDRISCGTLKVRLCRITYAGKHGRRHIIKGSCRACAAFPFPPIFPDVSDEQFRSRQIHEWHLVLFHISDMTCSIPRSPRWAAFGETVFTNRTVISVFYNGIEMLNSSGITEIVGTFFAHRIWGLRSAIRIVKL